jgi:shikimate kinase
VHLAVGVADGIRRTGMSTARPLLAGVNPRATFRALLEARAPLYREVATVEVDTTRRSTNQVARAVLEALGETSVADVPDDPAAAVGTSDDEAAGPDHDHVQDHVQDLGMPVMASGSPTGPDPARPTS